MSELEQVLNDHQLEIERLKNQIEILAEHLSQHATVMHIMARQIKQLSYEADIDISPPRMQ